MVAQVFSLANYSFKPGVILPSITVMAILLLGATVLIREKGSRVSLLYFVYTLTIGAWLISLSLGMFTTSEVVAFWWGKVAYIGVSLLPSALYHFTVVLLQIYKSHKRSVWGVWGISTMYLGVVLFTNALFDSMYRYSWGYYPKFTWLGLPFVAYFYVMMVNILRLYWIEFRKTAQQTTRHRRARAFLIAHSIGYIASLDFLPALGISYYPLGYVPMFILLVLMAQAIWRYRLVDITPAFAAHQIIDTMSDALLVLDREGVIRVANRASSALFGCAEQTMIGQPVSTIITDHVFSEHVEAVSKNGGIKNFEITFFRKENRMNILNLSVSALRDQPGRPVGIVCVARNVTDKKKMEEELLKSQKLESLGILAGGIAHDFNNLLTGIMGNISLARTSLKPEDIACTRLREAEKASLRARELTRQLLTFSKGGAPVKETASIGELIKDSTEFALRGSQVKSACRIPADLWTVEVDLGQMSQVIHNLVMNADQAMQHGGTIEVHCENAVIEAGNVLPIAQGRYVKISIKDQGTGIPKEDLQRIFDPYFTTKQKGSGLGLATVYSIIKKHHGYITVDSQPGVGTVFHIYLLASQKETGAVNGRSEKVFTGTGRILLMDDEEIVREVGSEMLRHLGYEVELANNGEETLEKYKKAQGSSRPFDFVVLDLTIPGGMGGKETIQRLLAIDPQVKAIVSSGYSDDPVMSNFKHYGFKGVVPKPYKLDKVSEVIHTIRRHG